MMQLYKDYPHNNIFSLQFPSERMVVMEGM